MKSTITFILMIVCLSFGPVSSKKVITIRESKPLDWPKDSLVDHPDKDVIIYKVPSPDDTKVEESYLLVTYNIEKGKIVGHKDFVIGSENKYNKAEYEWANDTTLNFRLYNTSNNLSETFTYIRQKNNNSRLIRE